jgi:hypothetical protein
MFRSSVRLAAACVAVSLSAAPAFAQSKKELVSRVLMLQQPAIEQMAKSIAERPAIQLAMSARQYIANVPADKREGVVKAIDADLKKYTDEAVPLLREAAIKNMPATLGTELENNFSVDELKQLINWFESPVVKRYQQMVPGIERTMAEKLVADTRERIEPKLKTLEASMGKHLGVPPGGGQPAAGAAAPAPAAPAATPGMPGNRGK